MTAALNSSSPYRMMPAMTGDAVAPSGAAVGLPQSGQKTGSALAGLDFQQLFSVMLLSMVMPSESGQSGAGANMMGPLLLLGMFEQLMSGSIEKTDAGAAVQADTLTQPKTIAPTQSSNGDFESSSAGNALDPSVPSGKPAEGVLTQGSHPGHVAVDLGIPIGTAVKTTMSGKVVYAGWNNEGYGNLVIVENGPYRTYYAHLSKIPVKVGDRVEAGQTVALSGNTGNSTGPHLHYEVRVNGQHVDPRKFYGKKN